MSPSCSGPSPAPALSIPVALLKSCPCICPTGRVVSTGRVSSLMIHSVQFSEFFSLHFAPLSLLPTFSFALWMDVRDPAKVQSEADDLRL